MCTQTMLNLQCRENGQMLPDVEAKLSKQLQLFRNADFAFPAVLDSFQCVFLSPCTSANMYKIKVLQRA